MAGAYSYAQALLVMRQLNLPMRSIEQLYRRMIFNLVARNQDDHVKNIAFLMDKSGKWSLAPAFDMTYSFNPSGAWTALSEAGVAVPRDISVCGFDDTHIATHVWPPLTTVHQPVRELGRRATQQLQPAAVFVNIIVRSVDSAIRRAPLGR
jgi:hypothetical protein